MNGDHLGSSSLYKRSAGWSFRTTLLITSLGLAFVLLLVTNAVFPSLTFAVVIIMVTMVLVYASSVVKAKFKGYLVSPITECLYMMGPTLDIFILLVLRPSAFPVWFGYLALPALLLGTTISVDPLVKVRHRPLSVTVRSLIFIFSGILLFLILSQIGQGAWAEVFLLGLTFAGAINLFGLFREHSNPLLSDMGRMVDRRAAAAFLPLAMVLLSAYIICWRPPILSANRALVGAAEWVLVALVALAFAVLVVKRSSEHRAENSYLKQQEMGGITSSPVLMSSDLTVATEAVRAFVDNGNSKRVIVLLVGALKNNGLDDGEIADLIGEVVSYREEEVALSWAWMYGNIQVQRKKDRIALLSRVLAVASMRSKIEARGTVERRSNRGV